MLRLRRRNYHRPSDGDGQAIQSDSTRNPHRRLYNCFLKWCDFGYAPRPFFWHQSPDSTGKSTILFDGFQCFCLCFELRTIIPRLSDYPMWFAYRKVGYTDTKVLVDIHSALMKLCQILDLIIDHQGLPRPADIKSLRTNPSNESLVLW